MRVAAAALLTPILSAALGLSPAPGEAQRARVIEETRVLTTYPFSEPERVPILTRDARLYPYHSFQGYAQQGEPREWKVIRLENDFIEVFVLPEVGGKVWGAIVKESGHEFVYRNEVMKFRNISLRGPWTSGGIEFNFGVIGHAPSTATPVDYVTRQNQDGSASVFVGGMDLPSRTFWRVEIRLPADRATFETRALWHNPTTLEQPYYNWMTAAAFARDDLELTVPGNAYLEHGGAERSWPVDTEGRYLPSYDNNRFGGNKSYHVVGELQDFFGGYYTDDDYGFGHWSRYEEMPGQKIWLWALSRQGGVWEDLLTDDDGQYIEFQAGRLLVQYSPGEDVNPITQVGFDPGAADRWSETWFPVEGLGGLTEASREGAIHVSREDDTATIRAHAFGHMADTLRIMSGGEELLREAIDFEALEPVQRTVVVARDRPLRIELRRMGIEHDLDPGARTLQRPFSTDPGALPSIPLPDRRAAEGRELMKGRRYAEARSALEAALEDEPWHRHALVGLAELYFRRGLYTAGMVPIRRALQLDAYDAEANFVAGNLYRALGHTADAVEAFGWAARAMAFRSVAYVQLAELTLAAGDRAEAERYARLAMDYDRRNLPARQILSVIARHRGDSSLVSALGREMLELDPLSHFVAAERALLDPDAAQAFVAGLRGEYPDQEILELAADYVRRGARTDAAHLLTLARPATDNPLLDALRAWLDDDPTGVRGGADPSFVFPFRPEMLPVLAWAAEQDGHWSWSYLRALNLWALERPEEAALRMSSLGNTPDFAPFYVARAYLMESVAGRDAEADLRMAVALEPEDRTLHLHLVRHLQDRERWRDALDASTSARARFAGDFNLDLMQVRSLNQLGQVAEAVVLLDQIQVLPSEHAAESHALYVQAHLLSSLDALAVADAAGARAHAQSALEWPENLGQGRPYEPEERLARLVLARSAAAEGDADGARAAYRAIVAATDLEAIGAWGAADLTALAALEALDRLDEIDTSVDAGSTDATRLTAQIATDVSGGASVGESIARLASGFPDLFAGAQGRILLRALLGSPTNRP